MIISEEKFWELLWGEEAYPYSQWDGTECPVTRSRFNEALERINDHLQESSPKRKQCNGTWNGGYCQHHNSSCPHYVNGDIIHIPSWRDGESRL